MSNTAKEDRKKLILKTVGDIEKTMQCNCDLDSWEPTHLTGHSQVCRIHKAAMAAVKRIEEMGL